MKYALKINVWIKNNIIIKFKDNRKMHKLKMKEWYKEVLKEKSIFKKLNRILHKNK